MSTQHTPEQVANRALGGLIYEQSLPWDMAHRLIAEAVRRERADRPERGYILFTGAYEVHHAFEDAEERLEALLEAGHDRPTMVAVDLTEDGEEGKEPLTLTGVKMIDTGKAGEIS